ncbi:MAG: glycosyltransferase family 61 protein [Alphaproteobacteria bacterium]|nr:MAG: glycosyltransferase family 61 protein [Alphaproteobacteria bacterium]
MMALRPLMNRIRRAASDSNADFMALAADRWEAAPAEVVAFPAATVLAGQLVRIRDTVFGSPAETLHALTFARECRIGPTIAYRFHDVDLVDGVLYKGGAEHHLRPRRSRVPLAGRPRLALSGALYDSWIGLRYFGNWLMDDCEIYRLAELEGQTFTVRQDSAGHRACYEAMLDMAPMRIETAHLDDLVMFDDLQNNAGRRARAADRRRRLLAGRSFAPHPGVFLLRGTSGDARRLRNEAQLANDLHQRYGIMPIDAEAHTVADLVAACAGARIAIGVEGSQLTHALAVMAPGGTFLALFPPDRVTAAMKLMTDRLGLGFAVVIGTGTASGFEVSLDEIEATLDRVA